MNYPRMDVHAWTDSEISYYRITQVQKEWNAWVENRVNKVRDIIPPHSWRHIPGTNNPAGLAMGEIDPKKLLGSSLWWHGPDFLYTLDCQWPDIPPISVISGNLEQKIPKSEAKGSTHVLINSNDSLSADISKLIDIEQYSSLVTAYM